MKHFLKIGWVVCLLAHCAVLQAAGKKYEGSKFSAVWNALKAKDGETVPKAVISSSWDLLGSRSIKADAVQTLENKFDLFTKEGFAPRRKIAHPHGVCYRGIWKIDTASAFTGVYVKGTEAPIIVRTSEAMGYVNRGNLRAFGFAGKIFPGVDPDDKAQLDETVAKTVDFFTIDDLGGTDIDQFFKSSFSNAPKLSIGIRTSPNVITLGALLAKGFRSADKQPSVRQLYPLAESGVENLPDAVTPEQMQIVGGDFGVKKAEKDFRLESRLANYEKPVVMQIEVRKTEKDAFKKIGEITLLEDVISVACDESLHFHHPKWRD